MTLEILTSDILSPVRHGFFTRRGAASSGVFAGKHTQDWAYDRVDADGKKFGDELKRIGWVGDEEVGPRPMHAMCCWTCSPTTNPPTV